MLCSVVLFPQKGGTLVTRRWVWGTVVLLIVLLGLVKTGWLEVHHAPTSVPLKVAFVRLDEVVQAHKAYSQLQALEQKEAQAKVWEQMNSIAWPRLARAKMEFTPQRNLSSTAKEYFQLALNETQLYAKQENQYAAAKQRYAAQQQVLEEQYRRPLAELHLKLDAVQASPEQKQKWQNDLDKLVQEKNDKLLQAAKDEDQSLQRELSRSRNSEPALAPKKSADYFTPIGIPLLVDQNRSQPIEISISKQALLEQIYGDIYSQAQELAVEKGYEAILTEPQLLLQPFDVTEDLVQRIKSL